MEVCSGVEGSVVCSGVGIGFCCVFRCVSRVLVCAQVCK